MTTSTDHLTHLGNTNTSIPTEPSPDILETFENTAGDILIPFICNEFTSLCPVTTQPDFARIEILAIPNTKCIESKSLKLYLFSYRNHGSFHESVTEQIAQHIWNKTNPKFLRVWGDFAVRGGISIKPLAIKWSSKISPEQKAQYESMIAHYDRLRYFDR